ncbi:Fe-S oxidoreductase [Rhodovulum sp. P5]|uniref:divergent polysaccharide deacetylase family protein n=1 Tax=Rhodovulum sp. P5 TaxID=1564506 RepID=UPI0009C26320|nr:divergent polysaccharide deacetylase family protein [Rhodovulum sp. P5]ARE38537.1 Fe-S oxidoreductase [Rhodovulum sp. P5]
MGKGVISGIVWGALVTMVTLVLISLANPLPAPDTGDPPVAVVADDAAAEPETPQVPEPQPVLTVPETPPAPSVAAQDPAVADDPAPVSPPAPVRETPVPQTTAPRVQAARPTVDIELPPGSAFGVQTAEPAKAQTETAQEPRSAPRVAAPGGIADLAGVSDLETAPVAAPAPLTDFAGEPMTPQVAEAPPEMAPEDPVFPSPAVLGPATPETEVQSRTEEPDTKPTAAPADPAPAFGAFDAPVLHAAPAVATDMPAQDPALERNAVPFTPNSGGALVSIVLIDVGEMGLRRTILLAFPFPVTFAIDPARPDADEAAAAYRAAGFEVVTLGGAGQPDALDRSVAVLDLSGPDAGAPLPQLVARLKQTGHGLLSDSGAGGQAAELAQKAGVDFAGVSVLDDEVPLSTARLVDMLDAGVLPAKRDGHAVVVAHSYAETVKALYAWTLESSSMAFELAPVSAVLRAR